MKKYALLVFIISLAFFLRFYRLANNPPSLNWDEVSHGYNAYSILKMGKDEWGIKFPLIFRAYGDYKLPLYIYLTIPFIWTLGRNLLAIRLVSVLSGVSLVFVAYLITKKITQKEIPSLFAAFLTAVSPWSLFLSRIAVEANLCAFLFSLGIYFFISWLENQKLRTLFFTFLFWGLSIYSYNSARVLVPILIIITLFFILKKKLLKKSIIAIVFLALLLTPFILQFIGNSGKARFNLVSLIDQGAVNQISEKRTNSKLPKPLKELAFNRVTFFFASAFKNYFSNLSPKYLFFRGGSQYQFSLPDHELLYLVTTPFLLIGILMFLSGKIPGGRFLVLWFFLAFIPSAITKDAPHVLRTILILPSPMILSAMGLSWLTDKIGSRSHFKGKFILAILVIAVLISFGKWWKDYQEIYPKVYSWVWQYGYQEVVAFVKDKYADYDQIYFTKSLGEPHEFFAFYWPWDPQSFSQEKKWDYHANWYWVNSFEKFTFVNDWKMKEITCLSFGSRCLMVTSPGNFPSGWSKIKTIKFLDGKPVFEILEKVNK